jgi:hypothetical protein
VICIASLLGHILPPGPGLGQAAAALLPLSAVARPPYGICHSRAAGQAAPTDRPAGGKEAAWHRSNRRPARPTWKELVAGSEPLLLPSAHDALTARLIERAGFKACQVGGFALDGTHYGVPDIDLI